MKRAIIQISISLLIPIIAHNPVKGKSSFSPWDADVKIADQNIKINKTKNKIPKKHHHSNLRITSKKKHRGVYNGPQGGGYFLIRFFQIVISPQDGPNCRFNPVCTAYGKKAVERYGILLGSMLAGDRILRCNPYSPPGDDPVPDVIFNRQIQKDAENK